MKEIQYYILFPNHDNAMRLYRETKALGVRALISPTPRAASKCCGVSLLVKKEDLDQIVQCAKEKEIVIQEIAEIEKDVNPNRDRYC